MHRTVPLDEIYKNFSFPAVGTHLSAEEAMHLAFAAALQGAGFVRSNPLVGAVLLDRHGFFVAGAWHQKFGEAHAEQALLEKIKKEGLTEKLEKATLYCTLEPCAHEGKTPSCSHLLGEHPLLKIIYGRQDKTSKVSGKGLKHLENKGIQTQLFQGSEELTEKLKVLTEHFECYEEKKKPFVTVKVASSLNGVYAHSDSKREWITGERSREYAHFLRLLSDAIVVGAETLIQDNPSLTDRHFQKSRVPLKVVLDPKGKALFSRKLTEQNILKEKTTTLWWLDKKIKDSLSLAVTADCEKKGVLLKGFRGKTKEEKLEEVSKELYRTQKARVLLEGGRSLWDSAFSSELCRKVYLFQAPKLFFRDDIMHWTKETKIQYQELQNGIFTLLDKDILIEGLTDASHKLR